MAIKQYAFCCIAFSTLSLHGLSTNVFKDKQSLDDTVHAFVILGKNVGDPAVKVGLPFMYLYQSGNKTYGRTPEEFLAAFGAYAAYEEFKSLTGMHMEPIPHIDANSYKQDSTQKAAAEILNSCIDAANKGLDLATPLIAVWLLKTACRQLD